MRIFLLIPVNFLILNIWLWITEYIFHTSEKNKKAVFLRTSLVIGVFVAFSLFAYPYIISYIGYSRISYIHTVYYPNISVIVGLLTYILIIFLLQKLFSPSKPSLLWMKEILLWVFLLSGGYLFFNTISLKPMLIYYFLVAASEEGLKYISSIQIYKKQHFMTSDLILYSILVSLGFAFLENIIYIFQSTNILYSTIEQITRGSEILLSRGVIGFLVHILFTGTIASLSLHTIEKGEKMLQLLAAFAVGIILHMSYNIFLYYHITRIIIVYLLGGYFLLTRIFWKSESLYLKS